MNRRIRKLNVRFISLVPKGANGFATIFKEGASRDEGTFATELLIKGFDDERGELTAVVYAPEIRDSQKDIASAEVIKEGMYEAAKAGFDIDIRHNENPVSKADAFVAESFIIQKADPRFAELRDYAGNKVDATGGWGIIIKIENAALREQYREGKWSGVSMGGTALVVNEKAHEEDLKMTAAELAAALAASNTALLEGIAKMVRKDDPKESAEAAKMAKDSIDAALVQKRALANKARIAKHIANPLALKRETLLIAKEEIVGAVDFSDMVAVMKMNDDMAEIDTSIAAVDAEIKMAKDAQGDPAKTEIAKLEAQIAKLQGRSNQSGGSGAKSDTGKDEAPGFLGLEKSDDGNPDKEAALGKSLAAALNKSRGYPVAA